MNAQIKDKNQTIVWKSSYINTTEFTTIKSDSSIIVDGHITGEGFGKLFQVSYKLTIDLKWQIEAFHIELLSDSSFTLSFQKNKNNQWVNEKCEILSNFNECTDIDISLTPFTNTLPINRLNLPEGSSKEINVIYIDLPTTQCKPVKQRYTNLGNGFYKYENLVSGFTSNIEVDENGFVLNYPGIWQRVFPTDNLKTKLHEQEVFSSALISDKPSSELGENAKLYDWLIGSWKVTAIDYLDNGDKLQTEGEWHFSWILEGRAVQDVWIAPKRSERTPYSSRKGNRYGSTLRFYDSSIQAWRIHWINPVSGASDQLVAKKVGNDIIHEGRDDGGNIMRWSFTDIKTNSFHWMGESSSDGGKTFKMEAEFFGTRK